MSLTGRRERAIAASHQDCKNCPSLKAARLADIAEEMIARLDELSLDEYGYRDSRDRDLLLRARALVEP